MIIGVILMIYYVMTHQHVGGLMEGIQKLSIIPKDGENLVSIFGGPKWLNLLSLVFLTSIGSWGMPQMIHKFYAIKDEKSISIATTVSTAFALLIGCGAYFVGSMGRLFFEKAPTNMDLIMPQLLQIALPEYLMSIVILLVLSASMSTLSSLVLTSSSAIAIDLVKGVLNKSIKPAKLTMLMRVLCLVFVLLSFIIANTKSPILDLMSFSWGTVAGAFIGPFVWGLYWKGTTRIGAWSGMVIGAATPIILVNLKVFDTVMAGMIAMLISLVIVPVVSTMTPKYAHNHISDVFKFMVDNRRNTELDV